LNLVGKIQSPLGVYRSFRRYVYGAAVEFKAIFDPPPKFLAQKWTGKSPKVFRLLLADAIGKPSFQRLA